MDRRTHHRVAQPLPPLGQGLGVPEPKGLGVLAPRLYPPHAEKALSKKSMIPDRLLVNQPNASDAISGGPAMVRNDEVHCNPIPAACPGLQVHPESERRHRSALRPVPD